MRDITQQGKGPDAVTSAGFRDCFGRRPGPWNGRETTLHIPRYAVWLAARSEDVMAAKRRTVQRVPISPPRGTGDYKLYYRRAHPRMAIITCRKKAPKGMRFVRRFTYPQEARSCAELDLYIPHDRVTFDEGKPKPKARVISHATGELASGMASLDRFDRGDTGVFYNKFTKRWN